MSCPKQQSYSSEVILTQMTLFNRRRVGEVEPMRKENYNSGNRNDSQIQEEVASSLSSLEKQLLRTMARVEMRGKRGRKIAVLLTKAHQHQMELLNKRIGQH